MPLTGCSTISCLVRTPMAYKQEVLTHLVWSAADSGVGSTIKTDGEESDPCTVLTVLRRDAHHVQLLAVPSFSALANGRGEYRG